METSISTVGVLVTLGSASFGAYAIYADFPSSTLVFDAFSFGFDCPEGSHLELSEPPYVEFIVAKGDDGYHGVAIVPAVTKGTIPCRVGMVLPVDAKMVQGVESGTDTWATSSHILYASAPTAPNANPVGAEFEVAHRIRRDAWGRHTFIIEVNNGFGPYLTPFPVAPDLQPPTAYKTRFLPPPGADRYVQTTPSSAETDTLLGLTWPNVKSDIYRATYESSRTRFWADHATELVTLSVGALLGVILTTSEQNSLTNQLQQCGSQAPLTQCLDTPSSHHYNTLASTQWDKHASARALQHRQFFMGIHFALTVAAIVVIVRWRAVEKRGSKRKSLKL